MIKTFANLLIATLAILLLTGCSQRFEEPQIGIALNTIKQDAIYYGDRYDDSKEDIEKRLKDYMIGKRFIDLPMIQSDDTIQVESSNYDVETIEVYDYILDDKCNIRSDFDMKPQLVGMDEEGKVQYKFSSNFEIAENTQLINANRYLIHGILIKTHVAHSTFTSAIIVLEER